MDSKKVIEKLFKIAEKQQRIITKLAQLAPEAAPEPASAPAAKAPASNPDAPSGLDPQIKAKLDSAKMPQLKGSLLVTPTDRGLKIDFNADRVKDRPSDLKAKLDKIIGPIAEIMGHMNPVWKANY